MLLFRLDEVCRVIEPSGQNLNATGPAISELLIIACVGVENHWRLILERNGFSRERFSTTDYVKILKPQKLNEYQIIFRDFPWLNGPMPFLEWEKEAPTKSLKWYDHYNSAKHNRNSISSRPILADIIEAVAAYAIMLSAQFGVPVLRNKSDVKDRLSVTGYPQWSMGQLYIHPQEFPNKHKWKKLAFNFEL